MSWRPPLLRARRGLSYLGGRREADEGRGWGLRGAGVLDGLSGATPESADAELDGWCWVGLHGGSGVSTLAAAAGAGTDVSRVLPGPGRKVPVPVVNVARTSAFGLVRAQQVARLSENGVTVLGGPGALLGLVLVADAPGRLPKPLAELRHLVSGGFSRVWDIPWVEAWRLGDPPTEANAPKELRRMVEDLRSMTSSSSTSGRLST
jgi:hypothetical protein